MISDPRRRLDAKLDLILAQALRARGRAIELHDNLMADGVYTPGTAGKAAAFATLVELDVNELVRQVEELVADARSSTETQAVQP